MSPPTSPRTQTETCVPTHPCSSTCKPLRQKRDPTAPLIARCLSPLFVPSEKHRVQQHLWITSLCRQCGSSVPSAAMKMGHQCSERQVQWFMLGDFVICGFCRSSLQSRDTEFDWQVGLVFLSVVSWQYLLQGSTTPPAAQFRHVTGFRQFTE